MRRPQRLRHRRDFAAVYRRGRPFRSEVLVLRMLRTGRADTRFGFVTSRELGNAVVRNRVKRRLREAARSLPVKPGCDLVINARRGAVTIGYQQLTQQVYYLMKKARVLKTPDEETSE